MRLDRSIALAMGCFKRADRRKRLPILMYHSVSADATHGGHHYYDTCTRPEIFARQMAELKELGFLGVDLETGLRELTSATNGERKVVITFDDGYRDFATHAAPTLKQFGFTATMFVPTSFIGVHRRTFLGRECLTWSEIKQLRAGGVRFGSHTVSHPKLRGMAWDQIAIELRASKEELENQLQEDITSFAYPYAFPQEDASFSAAIARSLRAEGYQAAVTTIVGRARKSNSRFHLPRLPVNSSDDERLLRAKLTGAYDWFGKVQSLWRRSRTRWFFDRRELLLNREPFDART